MTREDAIDVLKHNYPSACFTDLCDAVEIAIQALSAQPEIIRCEDCRYNYGNAEGREYNPNDIVCTYFDTDGMDAHDYCSYGERKSDGRQN